MCLKKNSKSWKAVVPIISSYNVSRQSVCNELASHNSHLTQRLLKSLNNILK